MQWKKKIKLRKERRQSVVQREKQGGKSSCVADEARQLMREKLAWVEKNWDQHD
jgi:hypothetical protein